MERFNFLAQGIKKLFRIDQDTTSKMDGEVVKPHEYNEVDMVIKINDTKSFDDLYKVLNSTNGLNGTKGFYDSLSLIKLIEAIRVGILNHEDQKPSIAALTNSCGLRNKVIQLLKESLGLNI